MKNDRFEKWVLLAMLGVAGWALYAAAKKQALIEAHVPPTEAG